MEIEQSRAEDQLSERTEKENYEFEWQERRLPLKKTNGKELSKVLKGRNRALGNTESLVEAPPLIYSTAAVIASDLGHKTVKTQATKSITKMENLIGKNDQ